MLPPDYRRRATKAESSIDRIGQSRKGRFMDPATIAAAALTILSPYVKDAGRELVKTVGEVTLEKSKALLGWLKDRFAGDAVAAKDLSRFESDPDKFESGLKSTLEEKAQSDPDFATELKRRVDEIGPQIAVFQRVKDGKNVVGVDADSIRSGKTSVTQDAERVDNITGVRAKTIG
jgi:hypothetical protein